eukprot:scaffold104568_cov63-Phaeocystis_antarctica.AAC.1
MSWSSVSTPALSSASVAVDVTTLGTSEKAPLHPVAPASPLKASTIPSATSREASPTAAVRVARGQRRAARALQQQLHGHPAVQVGVTRGVGERQRAVDGGDTLHEVARPTAARQGQQVRAGGRVEARHGGGEVGVGRDLLVRVGALVTLGQREEE